MSKSEFEKYATGHAGISSLKLHQFKAAAQGSISPTIIEERQMNVAAMEVDDGSDHFSGLPRL